MPSDALLLDTSVLLRFFVDHDDDLQPKAASLAGAWLDDRIQLVLLDLSVYELVNVSARRLGHGADRIRADVGDLFRLRLPMQTVDGRLAADAGAVAVASGLSAYDAAFLAAARRLGIGLVTGDDRLVEVGAGDAVHLAAVDLPD